MGGEGAMMGMIKSIKENRRQLKRKKFKEYLSEKNASSTNYKIPLQELTAEERKAMEARVQKIIAKDRRVSLIRNTIIIGLAFVSFIWLMIAFLS